MMLRLTRMRMTLERLIRMRRLRMLRQSLLPALEPAKYFLVLQPRYLVLHVSIPGPCSVLRALPDMSEIGLGKGLAAKGSSKFSKPDSISVNNITFGDPILGKSESAMPKINMESRPNHPAPTSSQRW